MEGAISEGAQQAAEAADRFAAAHKALTADASIQFGLPPADPPPKPPAWLEAFFKWLDRVLEPVGRFLRWVASFFPEGPIARFLLWTVIAVLLAGFAWLVVERLRSGEWRLPLRRRPGHLAAELTEEPEWAPELAEARSWLEEADALAAQGRFADAIHCLLLRSVDDIGRRRPNLVRPALTSRELAAQSAIPLAARELFAFIARLVERSLFAGRPVGGTDWSSARAAYSDFAIPRSWRA